MSERPSIRAVSTMREGADEETPRLPAHPGPQRFHPRIPVLVQLPLLIGLIALWLTLWGHVDVVSVVTGIIFAVLVVQLFYLPPIELSTRLNLWWCFVLVLRFLWWLVTATVLVSRAILRPGPPPVNSIIEVRLRSRSDWILTATAIISMLIPGTTTVDVDPVRSVLYLHLLEGGTREQLDAGRISTLEIEEALARAIGSREDLWRINRDRATHGLSPIVQSHRQQRFERAADARREAFLASLREEH